MMSCGKMQRAIQAYVDDAATREERAGVEAHVAGCEPCARALAESRMLVSLLAAAPERKVGDEFERKLALALRSAAPVTARASWWERVRLHCEWRMRVPALVTAGSLAVGVIAAVVSPALVDQAQQREQLRERLVVSAVERHEQLERANPSSNWEAVDGSIDLTTGSIFTE